MLVEPTEDAELARLLDAYGPGDIEPWVDTSEATPDADLARLIDAFEDASHGRADGGDARPYYLTRGALLNYIAEEYVRRGRFVPDEWDNLDATAPLVDGDGAAWRDWRAAIISGRVRHNRSDRAGRVIVITDRGVDVAWDGTDDLVFYDRYEAVDELEPTR